MSTDYGIQIFNQSGSYKNLDSSYLGGALFIEAITVTSNQSKVYTNVPGSDTEHNLLVFRVGTGTYDYLDTYDGNGNGMIVFTHNTAYSTPVNSTFLIFTKKYRASEFGIDCINDAIETLVSSGCYIPQYCSIDKYSTPSSGPYYTPATAYNASGNLSYGLYRYDFFISYSVPVASSSTPNYMIFWNLPNQLSTDNYWFVCDSNPVHVGTTLTTGFSLYVREDIASATIKLPEAIVFKLPPLYTSSDTYGIRVFDSSGGIQLDSGYRVLTIAYNLDNSYSIIPGADTNSTSTWDSTIPNNSYSSGSQSVTYPAMVLPRYDGKSSYTGVSMVTAYSRYTSGSNHVLKSVYVPSANTVISSPAYSTRCSALLTDASFFGFNGTYNTYNYVIPYTPTLRQYASVGTYTWVVPAGITSIDLVMVGGGGNSSSIPTGTTNISRGGGGGGQVVRNSTFTVTPGETLTIVVGASESASTITRSSNGAVTTAAGGSTSTTTTGGTSGGGVSGGTGVATGAGGGGGNSIGATGTTATGGNGGAGLSYTLAGITFNLGGGGGGGGSNTTGSASHGGGAGGCESPGQNGTNGTGGGAGGGNRVSSPDSYSVSSSTGGCGGVYFIG